MKFATLIDVLKCPFLTYNEWTKSWENDLKNMRSMQKLPDNPLVGWNIAISQVKPHSKVLSVGCGPGREVRHLVRKLRCQVVGIDYSENMIKLSKLNEPKAKYYKADMIKFRSNDKFDYITCLWNVINFIPDLKSRKEFIKNCYHNLRKGGYLIITTGYRTAHWRTFLSQILHFTKDYYPPKSQIGKWFEGTPFKVHSSRINSEILLLCKK
jgi:SAM-dependent methyltransferase